MDAAFLFSGANTQWVGMGKDYYQQYGPARTIYNRADALLGFNLAKICFYGPEEDLQKISIAQPAILVHSLAILAVLEHCGVWPACVAGHSLGEFAALVAAGVLSFDDALRLVWERATLIEQTIPSGEGSMLAILGAQLEMVTAICAEVSKKHSVQIANVNCREQIVVAGTTAGLAEFQRLARSWPECRCIPLNSLYAFHSDLMRPVQHPLRLLLKQLNFMHASIPVICNTSGHEVRHAESWRLLILQQLFGQVCWRQTIESILRRGIRSFVEVGPSQIQTRLVQQTSGQAQVFSTKDCVCLAKLLAARPRISKQRKFAELAHGSCA